MGRLGPADGVRPGPLPEPIAAVIDEVSAVTVNPAVTPGELSALARRDGLRVPPAVTRFDPNGGPPARADVTRVLSAGRGRVI